MGWPVAALTALAAALGAAAGDVAPPPLYDISAGSLHEAGLQQGRLAGERIRAWLASPEMTRLVAFALGDGSDAFQAFKRDNSAEFPEYVDEMQGIAEGAAVELDSIWCLNLIAELESLMGKRRAGDHCSDVYAVSPTGYAGGFAHGHNEDWPGIVHELWYFLKYTALPGANFESCAGMVYPGTMIGWTPGWNSKGLYMTMNSLYPTHTRRSGLSSAFIQREALCGRSSVAGGLDAAVATLARKGWAAGASINIVDLRSRRMASMETHEDEHAVREVTEAMGNYTHFNMYKNLRPGKVDSPSASTLHRQARLDSLPPVRSSGDIVSRLSDTADNAYPVFRVYTLGTFVLDGSSGLYRVWCCDRPAASTSPVYTWNLSSFWEPERNASAPTMIYA